METRTEQAKAVIEAATEDAPEYMRRTGWHQCSDVLDEKQALFAIEDQLGDPDYMVSATRTCAGFIVWNSLTCRLTRVTRQGLTGQNSARPENASKR